MLLKKNLMNNWDMFMNKLIILICFLFVSPAFAGDTCDCKVCVCWLKGGCQCSRSERKPYRIGIDGKPKYLGDVKKYNVVNDNKIDVKKPSRKVKFVMPPINQRRLVYDVNIPGRWYLGAYTSDGKSFVYTHTGLSPLADFSTVGHTNRYYYKSLPIVSVRKYNPWERN